MVQSIVGEMCAHNTCPDWNFSNGIFSSAYHAHTILRLQSLLENRFIFSLINLMKLSWGKRSGTTGILIIIIIYLFLFIFFMSKYLTIFNGQIFYICYIMHLKSVTVVRNVSLVFLCWLRHCFYRKLFWPIVLSIVPVSIPDHKMAVKRR